MESWNLLSNLAGMSQLPWCIIGDFNDLLLEDDKKGRVDHPQWLFNEFRNAVLDCNLMDIQLVGYPFTWVKSKGSVIEVEERLDRAMATNSWLALFPNAKLQNLLAAISDHSPILLSCDIVPHFFRNRRFKFENIWLHEPDLDDVVMHGYLHGDPDSITSKLDCCAQDLTIWGARQKKRFKEDIDNCKRKLEDLRDKSDAVSVEQYKILKGQLVTLLLQEDTKKTKSQSPLAQ